jgi:hypothetical protein
MFRTLLIVTATVLLVALIEFAPATVALANGTGP